MFPRTKVSHLIREISVKICGRNPDNCHQCVCVCVCSCTPGMMRFSETLPQAGPGGRRLLPGGVTAPHVTCCELRGLLSQARGPRPFAVPSSPWNITVPLEVQREIKMDGLPGPGRRQPHHAQIPVALGAIPKLAHFLLRR